MAPAWPLTPRDRCSAPSGARPSSSLTPLPRVNAYAMVRRRAAGIEAKIGNHSFRATGITAYLKNGGTLEKAASMANHASTPTTQIYDRRANEVYPGRSRTGEHLMVKTTSAQDGPDP